MQPSCYRWVSLGQLSLKKEAIVEKRRKQKRRTSCVTVFFRKSFLIQVADPQSWPVVIIVFAHLVRPHYAKQNIFQAKTMSDTGETVGLAEWIILLVFKLCGGPVGLEN